MVQNPPQPATQLFLPPLKPGASVGTDGYGQWQRRTDVTFDRLANSLALPEGKETGNVCSIPDIWARPLWVETMLTDNNPHPLRPAFKDQWKGMLAAIALAEVQGFDLRAKFLDLTLHPQDKLISSLLELIPDRNRSVYSLDGGKTNPWTKIFLFLWKDRPVGMTSPSTLLCPSADGDWTGLPWWQEGKLRSPLTPEDHLTEDEKTQLWLWLNNLKTQVQTCSGVYADRITELVEEFQDNLATALGAQPAAGQRLRFSQKGNYFGVPIDGGPLKALNTPIGAKPMPSSIKLMPRTNIGQKVLYIIPDRQTLTDQWIHKKEKDIWIYDTSLVNFNLEEFKRKLKANEDYLCVADIFLKDFYFIEEANQLPGGLMPQGYENVTYLDSENNEHHLTPLLPINPQLLNYFTPEELISKIELKPTQIGTTPGIQVSLTLPLSEGEYRIEREYPITEDHALNEVPVLEVWPNFQAPGWREYYAFYHFSKLGETQKTFRVQFPNVEAVHPPVIDGFQLSRLPSFPGFVTCQSEEYPDLTLGVILLKTPPKIPDGNPNKTWTVGVDFGTSFTNVYYSINKTARPLELSPLNLQVTAIQGGKRSLLLYQYFFSPIPQDCPLATVLTTKGTRGQQERIFDGRIYIPESQNLDMYNPEDDDIKTDLKWKRDNLNDNLRFLEHLALAIAAEATMNQVRILRWTFSYPSSFSPNDKSKYKANWQRIIEGLPSQTGLQSEPLQEGKYYRSESIALAHYFDAQEGKDLLYTTCIDMGGGSSDISIWVGRKLIHQCSVLLAGNLLFSQFVKQKPRFVQQQFKNNIDDLAQGTKEEAFYAKLNAVLSGKGEEWLRKQRGLIDDDPDLQYILQRTAIGISGLYYYVGSILQALHLEGKYDRQDNTPVYIGGNGCRIFHWLSPGGLFDSDCEAHRLFSRMLSKGSGFPDTREKTVLSNQPKAEVACGLVLDQRETRLRWLEEDEEPFAGEDCLVNGEPINWIDRLKLPERVKTFEVEKLTYLEVFLDDFHQALTDLRIQSIKPLEVYKDETKQKRLWADTKRTLDVKLLDMTGNVNDIRKEPPFILALKALLENIK